MNVFITGASSGLGAALAAFFRASGHTVLGTTNDPRQAETNPELFFFHAAAGVSIKHPCFRIADAVGQMFDGRVDLLINNIGVNEIRPFDELTEDFLRDLMAANYETPVFMTQAFLRWFNIPATVINIVSDAAWRPMRHSLAYNCSKAALDMASKQMARELTKPRSLSVIGIRPGKMKDTGMSRYIDHRVEEVRGWTPEQASEYFRMNSVTGLELSPNDVAMLVYAIAVSPISANMSGACLDLVG